MLAPGIKLCLPIVGVVFMALTVTDSQPVQDSLVFCTSGEYLHKEKVTGQETCKGCEVGFYMEETNHQHRQCFKCDHPHPGKGKIVIQPCSVTSNIKMGCSPGSFQSARHRNFHCISCRVCKETDGEFEVSPCTDTKNTLCGPIVLQNELASTSKLPPILSFPRSDELTTHTIELEAETENTTNIHECTSSYTSLDVIVAAVVPSFLFAIVIILFIFGVIKKKILFDFTPKKEKNIDPNDFDSKDPLMHRSNSTNNQTAQRRRSHPAVDLEL